MTFVPSPRWPHPKGREERSWGCWVGVALDGPGRLPGLQSPLATVELRHAGGVLETLQRGFFTHAAGTPVDPASATAIEAQLALVAGALAPYGAVPLVP